MRDYKVSFSAVDSNWKAEARRLRGIGVEFEVVLLKREKLRDCMTLAAESGCDCCLEDMAPMIEVGSQKNPNQFAARIGFIKQRRLTLEVKAPFLIRVA